VRCRARALASRRCVRGAGSWLDRPRLAGCARARAFHRHATHDGREAVEGRRGGGCEFFFFKFKNGGGRGSFLLV